MLSSVLAVQFFGASLDEGLVSYWNFDTASGSSGDRVVDLIGGNNGTAMNGPTSVVGIKNQAYSFDGVNDYISLQKPLADMNTLTTAAWVYINSEGSYTIFSDLDDYIRNDFVFSINSVLCMVF